MYIRIELRSFPTFVGFIIHIPNLEGSKQQIHVNLSHHAILLHIPIYLELKTFNCH